MRRLVFGLSILAAVAVGMWQGPTADSADRIAALSGSGGDGCNYDGYTSGSCTGLEDCTSGTVIGPNYIVGGEGEQTHRLTGGSTAAGTCKGGPNCNTAPMASELTTDGCDGS